MKRLVVSAAMAVAALAGPAAAGTIYQCTAANGRISYQDHPCLGGQRQQVRHVRDAPSTSASTTPRAPRAAPAPRARSSRAQRQIAVTPPPRLYRCTRATDGHTYLSRHGTPPPYLAPAGMLGTFPRPLAEVYGSQQGRGVGLSAPELANKPGPATIGGYMTPVQDHCQPLSPRASCTALAQQRDANETAIRNAFESERAPLRARREQLRTDMAGCDGY